VVPLQLSFPPWFKPLVTPLIAKRRQRNHSGVLKLYIKSLVILLKHAGKGESGRELSSSENTELSSRYMFLSEDLENSD